MKAVIMAGGKGTRLTSIAKDIPKPMFPILGKPILEYQINSLKESGITDIIIIVGHLGDVIQEYFADNRDYGVHIEYIVEKEPLGTAGALYYLKNLIQDDFILVFGDLILDVDFKRFMNFHKLNESIITLYGHPNSHPFDSDLIMIDKQSRVTEISFKKEKRDFYYHNFVSAGLYCISPKVLSVIKAPVKIDLENKIIIDQIQTGRVYAYKCTEYVKDMGTPDRLNDVIIDIRNGIVAKKSLKKKQKAIFLDRDGTINEHVGFLTETKQFNLLPGVAEAISKINASSYLSIIVTNQPVIARGECSYIDLEDIHMKMETELGKQGAYLDDIFFCPHHPDKGYEGEVLELKVDCECRKPKIGMLVQAAKKYNIDLTASWYIGDTTTDIQTGLNAGMRTILVQTGESGKDGRYVVKPNFIAKNLFEAINLIFEDLGCNIY